MSPSADEVVAVGLALCRFVHIQAAAELWTKYAQRQQELWSRQAREMTNLGQTIAGQSMDSVSQNVDQTLRAIKS